jgi:competence ComEA-like helix-hairpin-helix protein
VDCRRGGDNDKNVEPAESVEPASNPFAPSKKRACLLVSLIVLVWNVAATGRHLLVSGSMDVSPAGLEPAIDCAVFRKSGPLTSRQEYLLGKRVDVNRASFEEINRLPGISDAVARAVIDRRARRGGFRNPEELLDVPGIKEKRLKKILPFLAGFPNN